MRILLDESIDWRLKRVFDDRHQVETVRDLGWASKSNGDLLSAAEQEFDVLVTLDRGMPHQQNLPKYDLAVILITARSSSRHDLEPAMPEVNRPLKSVKAGSLYVVEA